MNQFTSIEKIDTGILYALELTSSISVLLLAFGLIASLANVLTKGSVLTDNLFMQRIWAWTQCIAIDASVAGTIIRTFRYYAKRERVKYLLYGFLSVLLLFTAAHYPLDVYTRTRRMMGTAFTCSDGMFDLLLCPDSASREAVPSAILSLAK
jgi:hypothetical protein